MKISLDERLTSARDSYTAKRPKSAALADAAAHYLPGGHTRTVLHFDPFPFRVARASGSLLTDVDGHTVVDLLGNYTAGLAGHSPTAVAEAVTAAMADGWALGATHPNEVRFAKLLVERFPSLERVRFTNSGTEANLMAISTARHVTGRGAIIVFAGGYHGGVLTYGATGQAINVPFDTEIATFNDLDSVLEIINRRGSEIAAVLVEPMLGSGGCIPAEPEFLPGLRTVCDDSGALLIFDEVMTSRLSPGGAQQRYNVMPDLTTFGKYLAGGMSFGAFGGRADILSVFDTNRAARNEGDPGNRAARNEGDPGNRAARNEGDPGSQPSDGPYGHLEPLGHAGTFNNNVLTMAAGVATLEQVVTADAIGTLNDNGEHLRAELTKIFEQSGLPMSVTGLGSLMNIHPVAGTVRSPADLIGADERYRELFFFDMLDAGFYLARRGFIALSLPLDRSDLDAFIEAVRGWCASLD